MEEKSYGRRKAAELDSFIIHGGVTMIPDRWSWICSVCVHLLYFDDDSRQIHGSKMKRSIRDASQPTSTPAPNLPPDDHLFLLGAD